MIQLKVKFGHATHADSVLGLAVLQILQGSELAAMATVRETDSYVHTAYFAFDEHLCLYFISQETDQHVINLKRNESFAAAVWLPHESWGEGLRGVQLFGVGRQIPLLSVECVTAMGLYAKRFPAFTTIMRRPGEFAEGVKSRMFEFKPTWIRLLDEPRFGRRNYITAEIGR